MSCVKGRAGAVTLKWKSLGKLVVGSRKVKGGGGENVLDTSVDHAVGGECHEYANCCAGDYAVPVVEVVDDFRRGDDGCSKDGSIKQYQLLV